MGANDVTQAVDRVSESGEKMGARFNKAGRQIDESGRFVKKGADAAAEGLKHVWQEADKASDEVEVLENKTTKLASVFQSSRNWGLGIAAAGTAGIFLSNSLIAAAAEGAAADAKLEAMFKKRGEGGRIEELKDWAGELSMQAAMVDDDPIKEAAAGLAGFGVKADQVMQIMPNLIGQARLYGQELSGVSEAFGRAFASGNASALKRSGVTLSEGDLSYINEASNEGEKQERLFERVKLSMDKYALSITEGMSEGERASNRFKNQIDSLQTAVGTGSQGVQKWVDTLAISLVAAAGANDRFAQNAGAMLTVGSYAAVAGGSVMAFTGQIGEAILGVRELHRIGAFTWLSSTAGALRAGAAAQWAAIQTAVMTSATTALSAASIGMIALWTGGAVVIVAALSAMVYKTLQWVGLLDDSRSLLGDLARGWNVLLGNTQEAEASVGREMYKKQMQEIDVKAAQMRDAGRSEEDIQKFKTAQQLIVEKHYGEEFRRHGDTADYVQHSERAGQIRQQQETMASLQSIATHPGGGGGAVPNTNLALAASGTPPVAIPMALSSTGQDVSALYAQIATVEAQIKATKNKNEKAALQDRLNALKAQLRDSVTASKSSGAVAGEEIRGKIDELRDATQEAKEIAQDDLDKQVDAIQSAIKNKTTGREAGQARIEALQNAFDKRQKAMQAASDAQVAELESQAIIAAAQATAATQEGAARQATMDRANAQAARKMRDAARSRERANRYEQQSREVGDVSTIDPAISIRAAAQAAFARLVRGGNSSPTSRGGGAYRPSNYRVSEPSYSTSPRGETVIQFPPLRIADPLGLQAAAL